MRKKLLSILSLIVGFSLVVASCSGGGGDDPITPDVDPDKPTPPVYPTFAKPYWAVDKIGSFEYTMSFAIVLPDSLVAKEQASDCMAVFSGSECRGIAERIKLTTGKYVWIGLAYGNSATDKLTVKYYCANTKYMYNSATTTPFSIDGSYGTVDGPAEVGMKIVTDK